MPLPDLKNLKVLDLEQIQLSDLTRLKGFVNLEVLFLNDNRITDLSPLAGLTNLKDLGIWFNPIPDEQKAMIKKALPNCGISSRLTAILGSGRRRPELPASPRCQ